MIVCIRWLKCALEKSATERISLGNIVRPCDARSIDAGYIGQYSPHITRYSR